MLTLDLAVVNVIGFVVAVVAGVVSILIVVAAFFFFIIIDICYNNVIVLQLFDVIIVNVIMAV
jgi:hypothetical protein